MAKRKSRKAKPIMEPEKDDTGGKPGRPENLGLRKYKDIGYSDRTDLGMSRFHELLKEHPQDLATYRTFVQLLNEDPALNLSMFEIELAARMLMENEKFERWILEEEDIEAMKGLESIFRMLRSNRDHLLRLMDRARSRGAVESNVKDAKKFLKNLEKQGAIDADFEVVEND